jgi:hypothetical protein
VSRNCRATYYDLVIVAEVPDTEIWLGDDEGHFVQKGTGMLATGLLPGTYVVEFGLGTAQYEIDLTADSHYTEAQLTAQEPSPRRVPKFLEQ